MVSQSPSNVATINSSRQFSENNIKNLSNDVNSINSSSRTNSDENDIPTVKAGGSIPMMNIETPIKTIRTTCPYCGVGCGVLASVNTSNGQIEVQGDPDHPANFGKLCSKGSNLAQTLGVERRLSTPYYQNKALSMMPVQAQSSHPQLPKQSVQQQSDWDTVLDDVANRLTSTIQQHGPDSVMFYVSGQLLTEDYYVANKLIKGFIGSNNIDSNSRLCMSSAVAGHKRAFGTDLVPGSYTDFESCDLLVLVGSNMAWCHPILFGRFLSQKQANPNKKLVVIDPRRTDSCTFADLHLPIAPGSDTHLYNGLLHYLNQHDLQQTDFTDQCDGLDQALETAKDWSIDAVAQATQVQADLIEQFYQMVADNHKTVTAFSMGVNQSSSGTDKVNAIINTHLLTGRVGIDGAGPFSLTGQPNAMGGREVGALSNLLAAHLDLNNAEHRQAVADFWHSPQQIPASAGISACDAADGILEGRIKAIWIMATNPVVSLPEADKFRHALGICDLVIVSECSMDSDTIKCADIVLPAQGWGEKSGTVTNSERRISRQRRLMPAFGSAKPDWWILSEVAKRMGFSGFDYQHPSEVFNEHVALTSFKNTNTGYPRYLNLQRALNFSKNDKYDNSQSYQENEYLTRDSYDLLQPFQWGDAHIDVSDIDKVHHKASIVAISPPNNIVPKRLKPFRTTNKEPVDMTLASDDAVTQVKNKTKDLRVSGLTLRMITGRLRDQWHTMTRTGLAPKLNQQQNTPTITIHPEDAAQQKIQDGEYAIVTPEADANNAERVIAKVTLSHDMRKGDAFIPMHWSDSFASSARVGSLIPTTLDPISRQPELKNTAVYVRPLNIKSVGRILVHPKWLNAILVQLKVLSSAGVSNLIWSLSRQQNSVLINIATADCEMSEQWLMPEFWQQLVHDINDLEGLGIDNLKNSLMYNESSKQLRSVFWQDSANSSEVNESIGVIQSDQSGTDNHLMMAIYVATEDEQLPSANWLDSCFADMSEAVSVKWLLAGRPASGYVDPGPIVCACMGVGENTIINTITSQGCSDASAVGSLCQAGTNCGSCIGQINELIKEHQLNSATEMV